MDEQLQRQRFEKKYFVTEKQVPHVREFLNCHLGLDQFSAGPPQHPYPIHSLYLDSYDLKTYWATVHCEKRRFKLRVRYYDGKPESPLFFELKRRENECVAKRRAIVQRGAGASLLAGHLPGPEHLVGSDPYQLAALREFCELMQRIRAHPVMQVAYFREAWMSHVSNSVRVTLDRQVRGALRHEALFATQMPDPVFPFGNTNVLELKFTNRFPDWFKDLVQHFNLVQTGAPKYCGSVLLCGEERVGWLAQRRQQHAAAEALGSA